jgi:hypothetical protein
VFKNEDLIIEGWKGKYKHHLAMVGHRCGRKYAAKFCDLLKQNSVGFQFVFGRFFNSRLYRQTYKYNIIYCTGRCSYIFSQDLNHNMLITTGANLHNYDTKYSTSHLATIK